MACFGFGEISGARKVLESFHLFCGVKSFLGVQEMELVLPRAFTACKHTLSHWHYLV